MSHTTAMKPSSMDLPRTDFTTATPAQSALGFFFALAGALIATSIVNIGASGVPLFILTLLVPVLAAPFAWRRSQYFPFTKKQISVLLWTGAVFLSLAIATFFQIALDRESPIGELSHAAIRLAFLLYFGVCVYYLHNGTLYACLRWLRRILTVLALYGIYQLPAKLLGLPLMLDWLRNNPSFSLYQFGTAGWVNLIRATSVYAEPSQCTLPVLALVLLNIYLPAPRYSKAIVWFAVFWFALLTFSRTTWLALAVLALTALFVRARVFNRRTRWTTPVLATLLVIIALVAPIWAFYHGNYKSDISRQERAGSIVIGIHLVAEHPWLGSGWNSFEVLVPSYQVNVEGANPDVRFRTIHNMFVSYTQQAGVAGFLFGLFPFLIMLFYSDAPNGLRLGSIVTLLAVAELSGDVAYSSLFWLWAAIIINWPGRTSPLGLKRSGDPPAFDMPHR